jgi:sucrose-phosphate synthase
MKKKYIQMFSIHGLVRGEGLEMGRDADTGGQIKYVIELANELSRREDVERVDLFTRLVSDPRVSEDYSVPVEEVNDRFRIIRIQCGGKKYFRKELLWNHLEEYIDKTVKFIKRQGRIPDFLHGHYADAGRVALELSRFFGVPLIFTGHSMGRNKFQRLQAEGMKEDDINRKYHIHKRIDTEEDIIKNADLVITSTNQEIEKQYGLYENHGVPDYRVIPPGLDIEKFYPYYHDMLGEHNRNEEEIHAHASVLQELNRFFMNREKPIVLTLCRPDKRKNISGLIKAFGEDKELQSMANLAIFAGIRRDIYEMEDNEQDVLTDMLLLMDKYDLYGKMAIPKKHDFVYEVPELYRIAASQRGVFVNVALTEPFGLTLIEASASGLPIVATNDGGPRDIMSNCQNGILVDPLDTEEINNAIRSIISDSEAWETYSKNGIMNVRKYYTWEAHVDSYLSELEKLESRLPRHLSSQKSRDTAGNRLASLDYLLVTDIDNTLIYPDNMEGLDELKEVLKQNREKIGFGIATGRTIDSAREILKEYDIPLPDIFITSVGSEIYYGENRHYDRGWDAHLANRWSPEKIKKSLRDLPFLEMQEEETQRKFKISYNMDPGRDRLAQVHQLLMENQCRYTLIYSQNQFLDILPQRASKGKAVRYISYKWEIPLEQILVCGDSGNDEGMLRGDTLGVIVGNYSEELETLKGLKNIFFARDEGAAGILEGMRRYGFITDTRRSE